MGNLNSIANVMVGNQQVPRPPLSPFGSKVGIFGKMSTRKAKDGVVMVSALSVNVNQPPHSVPPPPTVSELVRNELFDEFMETI